MMTQAKTTPSSTKQGIAKLLSLILLLLILMAIVVGLLFYLDQPNSAEQGLQAFEDQDYARAIELLTPEAEAGQIDAQYALYMMYSNGWGVEKNSEQAFAWTRRAAESGHGQAQYNLAILYDLGLSGVAEDREEAIKWYQSAAEQGIPAAQNTMGDIYLYGRGRPKDPAQALDWYTKSAQSGHANAAYNLAIVHDRGLAGPRDAVQAYRWYHTAFEKGLDQAKAHRDRMAQELTPEQIEAAQEQTGTAVTEE